jgi:hypothetical protein
MILRALLDPSKLIVLYILSSLSEALIIDAVLSMRKEAELGEITSLEPNHYNPPLSLDAPSNTWA